MLTREIMGLLALGVLWFNTLLVLAVAFKQLRGVRKLGAGFAEARRRGGLVRGEVAEAPDGRLAVRRIRQLGRAVTSGGPKTILFTDGPQSFEVLGGVIDAPDGELTIAAAAPVRSEVWHDRTQMDQAVGDSADAFDEALPQASKYKGFARDLELEVGVGDTVWVVGKRDGDTLHAPDEARPLVVSTVDPERWVGSRTRLLLGFIVGSFAILCGVTALALVPPVFGLVSTIGGALGLAYFLAIQPLGTAVRDAVKTPARQLVNGEWRRGS